MIPAIHRDLRLDEKSIALLIALPVLLLSVAAVGGSLLVARVGARRAMLAGLGVVGLAAALRGVGPLQPVLLAATFAMGVGVAVSQPAFPTIVRNWFPRQVALATGVYANGLLIGEVLPTAMTVPIVLPVTGQSWELDLAAWSLPVLLAVVLISLFTHDQEAGRQSVAGRWWPDWRSRQTWLLGLVFGCASLTYWSSNAFIPDYLASSGRSQLISLTLALVNLGQIPASLVVALAPRLAGRRLPFAAAGMLSSLALVGFYLLPGWAAAACMAVVGFSAGLILILALALPPLLAPPDQVARLSAGVFTITYACSFAGPLMAGTLWDLTRRPLVAFAPALLASLASIALAAAVPMPGRRRALP